MKRFKLLMLLVLAVAVFLPARGKDRIDSKIRFNDLYGEVSIRPNNEDDDAYEYAEFDTIIFEDDRIRTKEDSGAILGLEDMRRYFINPESIVIIHSEDFHISKIEIIVGSLWGNVKKVMQGKSIELEMSDCVLGMRGTIFKASKSQDGKTNRIEVLKGLIAVTLNDGNTVEVANGHRLETTQGSQGYYTLTKLDSNEISNLENEFNANLARMDEKLDEQKLNEKLSKQAYDINATNDNFETSYKALWEQKETAYNDNDSDTLMSLSKELDELALRANRYKGALKEAKVTISVARKKSAIPSVASTEKAVNDCEATIEKIEQLVLEMQKAIAEFREGGKGQSAGSVMDFGKVDAIFSTVMSLLEEISDGVSYDLIKSTKEKCDKCLKELQSGESSEQFVYVRNYVQKTVEKLASVPEIDTATIRDMNYIDRNIPLYLKEAKKRIDKHSKLDGGSDVEAKKSFVENATRTLSKCGRISKVHEKTSAKFVQLEQDFEKSPYKTSEYIECKKLWENIEQNRPELDNAASELNSCVDGIKSQLESASAEPAE